MALVFSGVDDLAERCHRGSVDAQTELFGDFWVQPVSFDLKILVGFNLVNIYFELTKM